MAFTLGSTITTRSRERISRNKERNVNEKRLAENWPDVAQSINGNPETLAGSLSSRHRINPWFTIVQSLFILTLRNDSTRFNPRVPTHYTLPRIYVVALLRILGFVFTFSSSFIISRPTWPPLSTDSVNIEANIDLQIWISI